MKKDSYYIMPMKTKDQGGFGLCLWCSATLFTEYIIRKISSRIATISPIEAFNKTFKSGFSELQILSSVFNLGGLSGFAIEESLLYDKYKVTHLISQDIPVIVILNLSEPIILNRNHLFAPRLKGTRFRHCCVINGYDFSNNTYRLQNSFGELWGDGGHFFIDCEDLKNISYKFFYLKKIT